MMVATHLLQSTACIGIAALLAFALRRAPARTRYTIWLFASIKFLVPLSLLTAAGTYLGAWTPPLAPPRVSVVMRWLDQSFLSWGFDQPAARAVTVLHGDVDRLALLTLAALWAAGVVSLTIWRWRQWRGLAMLAQGLPRLEQGRETEALERVARMMAYPGRLQVLRCDASIEPGVLGVFQPKLFWPNQLSDRLSDAELESLLAHEVSHVSRRDNLTALMQVAVETLFWFHPAVWWVGARLVSERERACDEEVLKMGTDNRSYAEGILKVCKFGFRAPVAFVAGIAGPRLAERIEWILERQSAATLTRSARLLVVSVVAASLGVPVAAGALSSHRAPSGAAGGSSLQSVVSLAEPERPVAASDAASVPEVSAVSPHKAVTTTSPKPRRAPTQAAPQVYRPGEGITFPRLVKEVKPKYTPEAMEAKIQGVVKLEAVVLETGAVGDVDIIESLDKVYGLDDEAVKCVSQWRFEPGTKDGKPVAVRVEVEMSFTLK